jgi:dihydropteroate synthase
MQVAPHYDDVVSDVLGFIEGRVAFAVEHGIREERICVDPGIGFGKTPEQNLELLRRFDVLRALGRPLLVGVSRKSTLGKVLGDAGSTQGTVAASVAAAVLAFERGATMIRAHDVRETVEALAVAAAVERGKIRA